MKKIVILGGGFGGVEFYKSAHKKLHGVPDVVFHLISRKNYFLFYPMLHEVATGSVERSHITQPLREIIDCCIERFSQTEIQHVDFHNKIVETAQGNISYDYLLVSLGTLPNYFNIPGADEHCVSFKSIEDAVTVRNHIIRHFEAASSEKNQAIRRNLLSFVIIGGGPTGVELAGQIADMVRDEMRDLYREVDHTEVSITLIEGGDRLLKNLHPELSSEAERRLSMMGVRVVKNKRVVRCEHSDVHFSSGEKIGGELRVWTAGTRSALAGVIDPEFLTERGGLKTKDTLQLVDHPEVFVIGDNMEIVDPSPMFVPQTAQAAAAAAKHAATNFISILQNQPLRSFKFESSGDIIPIGDWFGVAEIRKFHFFGPVAWIIRRVIFIQRLSSKMNRLKVTLDWLLNAVLRRDTSEL
ncbi:MAG: Pyr redox 2 protein [Patescibacteria group bacterium]|nr:Pyr redox 2 protein [Patescibacteria group bacterium]